MIFYHIRTSNYIVLINSNQSGIKLMLSKITYDIENENFKFLSY